MDSPNGGLCPLYQYDIPILIAIYSDEDARSFTSFHISSPPSKGADRRVSRRPWTEARASSRRCTCQSVSRRRRECKGTGPWPEDEDAASIESINEGISIHMLMWFLEGNDIRHGGRNECGWNDCWFWTLLSGVSSEEPFYLPVTW